MGGSSLLSKRFDFLNRFPSNEIQLLIVNREKQNAAFATTYQFRWNFSSFNRDVLARSLCGQYALRPFNANQNAEVQAAVIPIETKLARTTGEFNRSMG